MENLKKIIVSTDMLDADLSLSPEFWLSSQAAQAMSDGVLFDELATISRHGLKYTPSDALVLDTGNAERGLISLKTLTSGGNDRISHKKLIPEGSVIISRLRPYLRQVAYIPNGISDLLKTQEIYGSTEFYVLVPTQKKESIAFLVPWLLSEPVQNVFLQATTGGHHPRFDESLLRKLTIPKTFYGSRDVLNTKVEKITLQHLRAQLEMAKLVTANN